MRESYIRKKKEGGTGTGKEEGRRMRPHCSTRAPAGEPRPVEVIEDPEAVAAHLEDAAHYPGGSAAGIAFPQTEADVAALLRAHSRILPVGAQSSLTGGATPFGEVLLSTARMNRIVDVGAGRVTVEAGVSLAAVEETVRRRAGATYPPRPTFTGAFAGGSVATNAAGAATFKYGTTRDWVEALTVILANGEALDVTRGACLASERGFLIQTREGGVHVPVPTYRMPSVAKHSAGYFAAPGMDLIDLFIGSEGTLGIVTGVTFRLLSPAPSVALALVLCPSEGVGLEVVQALRDHSRATWLARDPAGIDVCAIEHMDARSLSIAQEDGAAASLNVRVPPGTAMALLIQLELPAVVHADSAYEQIASSQSADAPDGPLVRFCRLIDRHGLLEATEFAAPGEGRRMTELLAFREAVPAGVNHRVGVAKRTIDVRIEKTAADMIVPFERFAEMMLVYRMGFESRGLDYAVWGHISDGNVHPNVIPRSYADVASGKSAILEFGREVARLGGCPLAEHGVGRNPVKQSLLRALYGDEGINQMRAVKQALDPDWKLAPGVIFTV
jgi:D-lactate dehydrogenase (cytochrome)